MVAGAVKIRSLFTLLLLVLAVQVLHVRTHDIHHAIHHDISSPLLVFVDGVNGNDSNNGTSISTPFRSVGRARDYIRTIQPLQQPVLVNIRRGVYDFSESGLVLNGAQDSGTNAFPITYTAYQQEHVLFSGGREVCSIISWVSLCFLLLRSSYSGPATRVTSRY